MGENLQVFFDSISGQVTVVATIALVLVLIAKIGNSKKADTGVMVKAALLIGLAFVLNQITLYKMPAGGSITPFSMFTIFLVSYLFGTKQGILAGIAFGLLDLLLNPYVIHPVQMLLDYPLAFGALGIGGLLRDKKFGIFSGYLLAITGRYLVNVASGVIFFSEWAPEGFSGLTWALYYNLTYIGVEGLMTIAILCVPVVRDLFEKRLKNVAVSGNVASK